MKYLITAIIGYLFGCFNTAYFVSKTRGFDIRDTGSGNAGASNIKMQLGWTAGAFTAFVDILKTILAISLCRYLYPDDELVLFLAGVMSIIGHIFPFYMNFKGGKGFACYIGMLIVINWELALVLIIAGFLITIITNYIALATMFMAVATPIYYIYIGADKYIIMLLVLVGVIILYKHKINVIRIINHEEAGLRKKR